MHEGRINSLPVEAIVTRNVGGLSDAGLRHNKLRRGSAITQAVGSRFDFLPRNCSFIFSKHFAEDVGLAARAAFGRKFLETVFVGHR